MQVSYGPPGHKGVTQIMGLGANPVTATYSMARAHRSIGLLSAATWLGGVFLGSNTAKNIGIGGVLAVVYIQMLAKKPELPAPPPTDVQGWA